MICCGKVARSRLGFVSFPEFFGRVLSSGKESASVVGDRRPYLLAAVILAGLMATLFVTFLVAAGLPEGASAEVVQLYYPAINPSGPGYVTVTDYFRGEDVILEKWRISRPIVPLLALPLSYIMSTELSFLIVNSVLFVLLVGAFYELAERLLATPKQAFYAAILLIFAFPVYYRGINVSVDLASWLIFVVTALVLLELERRGAVTVAAFSVLAVICALGTLVTELVFAAFLLVLCFYLIKRRRDRPRRRLLGHALIICASFAAVILVLQLIIYLVFDYGFFDKTQRQLTWFTNNPLNLGPAGFVRVLGGAFLASLLLVPVGLPDIRRSMKNRELLLAMLVSALFTLAAVYTNSIRFVFVLFPVIFPIAVLGVVRLAEMGRSALRIGRVGALVTELALLSGVCAFNLLTYAGFLRYGSTIEMARRFLPFLT